MFCCLGSENRVKSSVSPKTATFGLKALRAALNVAENVVGAPLDGSDSSIIRTARGNGAATADVNVAATVNAQTIDRARIIQAATYPMSDIYSKFW